MGQSIRGNCVISTQSFCESKNAPGSLFESESKLVSNGENCQKFASVGM